MYMPQSYDHTVTGQVIRRLRLERGMSQEILSGLAALSRSHLAEIESGKDNANVETLWRIAGGLDLRLSELIRQVEEEMERRA
jgi:transcriptional regulator with XRE-family HTH domain